MRYLILLIVALTSLHAFADDEDSNSQGHPDHGWFWYEEPPVEVKKPPEQKPAAKTTNQADSKKPMSVEWLRKMLPILQERAVDNPTRENLAAYFYAQRVEMDKAQRFAEAATTYIASNPVLDENNRVPLSSYGHSAFMDAQYVAKKNALEYLSKNIGGIFFFFESTCDFCKTQVPIINSLKKTYGFEVTYISMDGKGLPGIDKWVRDNGHSKLLKLKVYPTTVFVVPPKTYIIVSQGIMAKDQLEDHILTAATSNDLLPENMAKGVNPFDNAVLTTKDMSDGASNNPSEIANTIDKKLMNRY